MQGAWEMRIEQARQGTAYGTSRPWHKEGQLRVGESSSVLLGRGRA